MSSKLKHTLQGIFLLVLIVATIWIVRTNANKPYQKNVGTVFGTEYHITYQSSEDLGTGFDEQLTKVDKSLSMFNKNSTISKINRNETVNLDKDPMFVEVFNLAHKVSESTDGFFDITVAPLVNEWGFGFKKGVEPTQYVIDSLLKLTDYRKVQLAESSSGTTLRKANPHAMLDCSAIAKGFGVDVVARFLDKKGVPNYLIEIGGEIRAKGHNAKGTKWTIGVSNPTDSHNVTDDIAITLSLTDCSLATSGNYRNFYYKNGKKYAHTIDPHTGYPVQHSILSSTVIAPTCAEADAYATSFMVMGLQKAQKVLSAHPQLKALFIYTDESGKNKIWSTHSLDKMRISD